MMNMFYRFSILFFLGDTTMLHTSSVYHCRHSFIPITKYQDLKIPYTIPDHPSTCNSNNNHKPIPFIYLAVVVDY